MKLLILDRDGVINQDSDAYIKSLQEWIPIPGALEAIAQLSQAGWTVAVATNQSGLARGYYDVSTLDSIHAQLRQRVAQLGGELGGELGVIVYCPHAPDAGCDCRKPKPGMLHTIAAHYRVALRGVWFVGDSLRDLEAALAVECQPVLVKTGKGQQTLDSGVPASVLIFDDLAAVAARLLHL